VLKHLREIPAKCSPIRGNFYVGYINFAIFDQYLAICGKRYKMGP